MELQFHIAELNFVTISETGILHTSTVDKGPVGRAHVKELVTIVCPSYPGMLTGDGRVVNGDLIIRTTTDGYIYTGDRERPSLYRA